MKSVTIKIGEDDLKDLQQMFKKEADFNPKVREDFLIISVLKQVLDNPKTEVTE
jgi:hypothetical protein